MEHPETLTNEQLCAFLDAHSDVEARAILARNLSDAAHILDPHEAAICQNVLRGDPVARDLFPAIRDRIMLRWATSARDRNETTEDPWGNTQGEDSLRSPAGASRQFSAPVSSPEPAGEASTLPAGPGKIGAEWTFTCRPDGRIFFQEGK